MKKLTYIIREMGSDAQKNRHRCAKIEEFTLENEVIK